MYLAGVGAVGRVGRPGLSGNGARRPSFDVDFVGSGSLGAGAVFTRASVGTYYNSSGVLVSAAINTPRFDYDPVTLQLKGLLLEDASTNIAAYSGDISQVNWGKYGNVVAAPTVTANQAIAPDGTLTASRVVYPAVTANPQSSVVYQAPVVTATQWTLSVWLRGNVGGEQLYLSMNAAGVFYSSPRLALTASWQRFSFTSPSPLTAVGWTWDIGTDFRDPTLASTPAQTVFIWGAQFEALPYMSSHIPTTSVSVTRAVDVLRYPIASVTGFNTTQGSLAHDYIMEGYRVDFSAPVQFVGVDSGPDYISADEFTTGGATATNGTLAGAAITAVGVNVAFASYPLTPTPAGPIHRGSFAWKLNAAVGAAHDGVSASSTTGTATSLPVIANLTIAGYMHYQNPVSQWARRTRYWPRQLSQAELISATTLDGPTLSLDFMQPDTLDPRITFTRASSATYTDASGVVQTAATNAPRWDYASGVLRGLLIEEARTNLIPASVPTSGGSWALTGSTAQGGSVVAPDGTTSTTSLISATSTATDTRALVFLSAVGATPTTAYTVSMFLKKSQNSNAHLQINIGGGGTIVPVAYYDLTNGTAVVGADLVAGATNKSVSITPYPNGWYRCVFTFTTQAGASNITPYIGPCTVVSTSGDNRPAVGVVGQGIYVWGAQVEQGAFPTSYIPTTSVSVTRAQDVCQITPLGTWYNAANYSLLAEFDTQNVPGIVCGIANAFGDASYLGGSGFAVIGASGTPIGVPAITVGPVNKECASLAPSRLAISNNGGAVASTGNGAPAQTGATRLSIGMSPWGLDSLMNGHIRRVQYWNRALSDAEMQQVTT